MTTVAMNSLWEYIKSLSLSRRNRKWLAERLISFDEEKESDPTLMTKEEYFARLDIFVTQIAQITQITSFAQQNYALCIMNYEL